VHFQQPLHHETEGRETD